MEYVQFRDLLPNYILLFAADHFPDSYLTTDSTKTFNENPQP